MYLHEFQAKELLCKYGFIVPKGKVIDNVNTLSDIRSCFSGTKLVLKSQIHSGARGKAGGILLVDNNYGLLLNKLETMLNKQLVTSQTDLFGKSVNYVLIEEYVKIEREFYFSIFIDRKIEHIVLFVSSHGGEDIESQGLDSFFTIKLNLLYACYDFHIRELLYFLNLDKDYYFLLKDFIFKLFKLFIDNDLVLLEINPVALFNGRLICLDAKVEIDDNASFRQLKLVSIIDYRQKNFIEVEAEKHNLSYVLLDGNIGCIVNGAGLAMATMDVISLYNGKLANFLDIGGDANEEKVFFAFKVILLNKNVKCIFINIFGGIVRCDVVADSIVSVVKRMNIVLPIVIRLIGNMSKEAINIINDSNLNIILDLDFASAVQKIIYISRKKL